jgi:biotin carboxyl carrier protein
VGRDHRAIDCLADDLLPALIAKLAAGDLGEIEIREGAWKARLRKPAGSSRSAARAAIEALQASSARAGAAERGPVEAAHGRKDAPAEIEDVPIMAVSPAVGVFQPRKDLAVGLAVRAGDRLGTVDVLGVREDVVSPIDGVVGTSLVEAGEAVEYGQGLIRIAMPEKRAQLGTGEADREAAAVLGEA